MHRRRTLLILGLVLVTFVAISYLTVSLVFGTTPPLSDFENVRWYLFVMPFIGLVLGLAAWSLLERLFPIDERYRASEERYRRLVETSPDAIGLVTTGGTWQMVNQGAITLFGAKSPSQLIGDSIYRFVALEEQSRLQADLETAKTAGTVRQAEYRMMRSEGPFFLAELSLSAIRNSEGEPEALIVIVRDISERKRTEEQLRDKVTALQMLAEIDQAITSALGLSDRLDVLLKCAQAQMQSDSSFVFLLDASGQRLQALAHHGTRHGASSKPFSLQWGEGAAGWIARNDQPLAIPDVTQDARWKSVPATEELSVVSYLGVPLHIKGRVIGVLDVSVQSRREFTREEVEFLTTLAGRASVAIENARLFDELQHRANEFAALYDTTRDLGSSRDVSSLLQIIVDRAASLLGAGNGHVYIYDQEHSELELAIIKDNFPIPIGARLAMGEGMAGRVAQSRHSLIIDDYHVWEHRSPQFEGIPFTSILQVPMLDRGELIGVLGVNEMDNPGRPIRKFTQSDERILTLFAAQAASAIHNARLFEETRTRAEQMALLYDAGLALNSVLEPHTQLEFLLKIAMKALHSERSQFFRFDSEENTIVLEHAIGYVDSFQERLRPLTVPLQEEKSIAAWVARNRVPLNVGNVLSEPRWVTIDPELRSGIWAPVQHENQLRGVIAILSTQANAFSAQDERLLVLFANQVSVALENARLFSEARRRTEQLGTVNEMSRALASTFDLHEIHHTAFEYIRRLVNCPRFALSIYHSTDKSLTTAFAMQDENELDPAVFRPLAVDLRSPSGEARAIASGQPIILVNLSETPKTSSLSNPQNVPLSSMFVPMIVESQAIGILQVQSYRPRAYRQEEADLLGAAGNQIGLAIHNATLFAQTQQRAQELALVNQISAAVNQPVALDQVLHTTLRELTQVLKVDRGLVAAHAGAGEHLTVIAEHKPHDAASLLGVRLSLTEHSLLRRVLAERQAWAVPNAQGLGPAEETTDLARELGARPLLIVPLVVQDQAVGVVVLESEHEDRKLIGAEIVLAQTIANQAAAAIEKARLFEETRRRADQLAVVNRVASAVNRTLDLDELLQVIHSQVTGIVPADAFFIALYDASTDQLDYRVRVDEGAILPSERRPLAGLSARLVHAKAPLLIRDWASDPTSGPPVLWGSMQQPRSWLGVPMLLGENVVGIISVQSYKPNVYGEEELRLLITIADQVAVLIDKARLFGETRRRALEQSTVSEIARTLSAALDVREAFPAVVAGLRQLVDCERVSLALLEENQEQMQFVALDSPRAELARGTVLGRSDTAATADIISGVVHLTTDLALELDRPGEQALFEAGFRSRVNLPLKVGERVIGSLNLASRQRAAYSMPEVPVLQLIANTLAAAIENTRLYESAQTRREELAALYALSRSLSDATNFDTVLDIITRHSVDTLHVAFARVALIEGDEFVLRAAFPIRELERDLGIGRREKVSDHPSCIRVLESNTPDLLHVEDQTLGERERETLFSGVAHVIALIPLRTTERPFGILILGEARSEERESFTADKMRLARSIANQAASTLRRAELFEELEKAYLQTVLSLANAVNARDAYTADHAQTMEHVAQLVGRALGMSGSDLEDLRYGVLLHDIGKIGIPDAILQKPGPLTPLQWEEMRRHPEIGAQIIRPISRLRNTAQIVLHHHERFDGLGYPKGIAGGAIPLGARILAVIDAYRAIVDKRVYKPSCSHEQAMLELERNAGTQFDPAVVQVFCQFKQKE